MGRKEQATASRAALVAAARECFTEAGYEDTTVAAILARTGMARGALYHYFPDGKAEIFRAVFDELSDGYHERRDALRRLASPTARLRAGIALFLELCAERDFARVMLTDAPHVVPGHSERGTSFALLREQVGEAVEAGELRRLDVDAASIALYGAVRGAGTFVIESKDDPGAIRTATRTIDLFLDGLRRTG